jgi:hypothetical protein
MHFPCSLEKTAQLIVENSAQTTFRFYPISLHAPQPEYTIAISVSDQLIKWKIINHKQSARWHG